MNILITGVTRTGNLGGTAMLCAVEEILRPHSQKISLASILPKKDSLQTGPDTTEITNADYRILVLFALPLCILLWPFRNITWVKRTVSKLPIFKHYYNSDKIVDISGISFVDGRGLPLLLYNIAIVIPGLFFNIPTYKLSQAVGPFNQTINKIAAKWVFKQCDVVIARGEKSYSNLEALNLNNIEQRCDTSFALTIPPEIAQKASGVLENHNLHKEATSPIVLLSPSMVVNDYCKKSGIDLKSELTKLIEELVEKDIRVGILPHSTDTGIKKNNDHALAVSLRDRLHKKNISIPILDAEGNPYLARALIAQSDVFIACRFHSLIAALSQSVPVLTLGWSHKYAEAAAPFGMDEYTLDYSNIDSEHMGGLLSKLLSKRMDFNDIMKPISTKTKSDAISGIKIAI